MRLAGEMHDVYCVILAYSPELKQLIVRRPEQENFVWLIQDLDCGSEPLMADSAFINLQALSDSLRVGSLKIPDTKYPSAVKMPVTTEWIVISPHDCIVSGFSHLLVMRPDLLGRPVVLSCEGLDPTKNMVLVGDTVYNYEQVQAKADNADYSLDALIQFVQDINEKYASRHVCASLRIKGPKFIQMFFDGICVLKNGEKIEDVGYEEVSRRIAHVAECI